MSTDLESLRKAISGYLEERGFAVFHGSLHLPETGSAFWDVEHYSDFRPFVDLAERLEVKLVLLHHRQLSSDFLAETRDQLEDVDMPEEEYAEFDRRLREIEAFEGFTCSVELSFDFQGRTYLYVSRAPWYEELLEIAGEIEDYLPDEEDLPDSGGEMDPYFSKN